MSLDRHHPGLAVLTALLADDLPLAADLKATLQTAVAMWFKSAGAVPLDRCLRLPSPAQHRRAQRDRHLADALRLVDGRSELARAIELRRLLALMASSCWRRWRASGGIPAHATALQRACVAALSNGKDSAAPTVPGLRLLRELAAELR